MLLSLSWIGWEGLSSMDVSWDTILLFPSSTKSRTGQSCQSTQSLSVPVLRYCLSSVSVPWVFLGASREPQHPQKSTISSFYPPLIWRQFCWHQETHGKKAFRPAWCEPAVIISLHIKKYILKKHDLCLTQESRNCIRHAGSNIPVSASDLENTRYKSAPALHCM